MVRSSMLAAVFGLVLFPLAATADAQVLAQAGPRQAQPAPPAAPGIDAQINDLKSRLKITPAQQPQFDAVAQAMRQNGQDMESVMRSEQKPGGNAIDNVRTAQRFAEVEAQGLQRLLPPLEALYNSLSDQQKRTADQLFSEAPPEGAPPQGAPPKGAPPPRGR